MMASGYNRRNKPKLAKILTSEILEELTQADGDNRDLFFLLVSARGIEDRSRRSTSNGQHGTNLEGEDDSVTGGEGDDNDQMDTDDNVNTTGNTPQSTSPPVEHGPEVQNNPSSSSSSSSSSISQRTQFARKQVHEVILPEVLRPDGWKKVYDKDSKLTYQALYFGIIERQPGEDENAHNQRVGRIRETIREKVITLQRQHGVEFKINSLLSKPILYNEPPSENNQ